MRKGFIAASLIVALLAFAVASFLRSPYFGIPVSSSAASAPLNTGRNAGSDDGVPPLSLKAVRELQNALDRIVRRPHFRYYSAALEESCPYWAVDLLCSSPEGACTVCICDEDQVPRAIRTELTKPLTSAAGVQCDDTNSRDRVAAPLPEGSAIGTGSQSGSFPGSDNRVLVDLLRNPEANTNYVGEMATRIWQAIYDENCFAEGDSVDEGGSDLDAELRKPLHCRESALVYQLFSGLHASISTHIAVNFYANCTAGVVDDSENAHVLRSYPTDGYTENEDELHRRVLQHPSRVQNLRTLLRIVLEAVNAVRLKLLNTSCHGGIVALGSCDDRLLLQDFSSLFASIRAVHEDGSASLQVREALVDELTSQRNGILRAVQNVTSLMDCLTCEKCRLWGGLQLSGLYAAVRILASPAQQVAELPIDHREIVALVNLFRQLTFAVSVVTDRCPRAATE